MKYAQKSPPKKLSCFSQSNYCFHLSQPGAIKPIIFNLLFIIFLFLVSLPCTQSEICYQALYPIAIGGQEYTTTIFSLDYDSSFNLAVGGLSRDSSFISYEDRRFSFVSMISKVGKLKWSKEMVKPTSYANGVIDVDFTSDDSELVIILQPANGYFVVKLGSKYGDVIVAYHDSQYNLFGAYTNYGSATVVDEKGDVYSTIERLDDCNVFKFEFGPPGSSIDLEWNLEFNCYDDGGFSPQALEIAQESDRLYIGGHIVAGKVRYPALGLATKKYGNLLWVAYHEYYQDETRIDVDPEYHSNFRYSNTKLEVKNSDETDYIMGCSSPHLYGQFVIVQQAVVSSSTLISIQSFYLDYPHLFRNPGGLCKAIHSSSFEEVTVLFSAGIAQQQVVIFHADLEKRRAFVQEIASFNFNFTIINQGIFLSKDLLFYAGQSQEINGFNSNTQSVFSFIMSISSYQSFLDFQYEEFEVAIFVFATYTLADERSLYNYGNNHELEFAMEIDTMDTKADKSIIQIESGYFIYPNSLFNQIEDEIYMVGSGKFEKEVVLKRENDCELYTKYYSYLEDGSRLPRFLNFNPSSRNYTIESSSNKDVGSYKIVFSEQLSYDKDVLDDSLSWILTVLPYNPTLIPESVSPPYFISSLEIIVVEQGSQYKGSLPQYTSDDGNEVTLEITKNEGSSFVFFSKSDREILAIPSTSELGTYVISIILKNRELGIQSEVYYLNVTVLEKPKIAPVSKPEPIVVVPDSIADIINENMELYNSSTKLLTAKIESINQLGMMTVKFSQPIKIPSNMTQFEEYLPQLVDLQVTSKDKQTLDEVPLSFNWTFTSLFNDEMLFQLDFEDALVIQNSEDIEIWGHIEFKDRYFFVSEQAPPTFLDKTSASLEAQVPDQMKSDKGSQILVEYGDTVATGVTVLVYANLGVQLVMSSSLSLIWGMINVLQLLVHLPLIQEDVPSNTLFLFQLLFNMTNFNLLPLESVTEKIFDFHESEPFSTRFEQFDYSTLSLISNLGDIFYYMVALLVIFGVYKLLKVTRSRHIQCLKYIYKKLEVILTPGFYIRFFIESYLELGLCAFLGSYEISKETPSYVFNSIITFWTLLVVVGLPILLCALVFLRTEKLSDEHYFKQYVSLFELIRIESPLYTSYIFIFVLRRFIFVLMAIYMQTFKMSLFFFQSLLVGAYLIYFKPFTTAKLNYIEIFNEETITIVALLFMMCELNVENEDMKYKVGWAVIVAVLANILVNNLIVLAASKKAFQAYYYKFKQRVCKKKKVKKVSDSDISVLNDSSGKYLAQGSFYIQEDSRIIGESPWQLQRGRQTEQAFNIDQLSYGNEKVEELEVIEESQNDIVEERKSIENQSYTEIQRVQTDLDAVLRLQEKYYLRQNKNT